MGAAYKRILGRSGTEVSALGLGCWAIGGPFEMDGRADGWGEVDDAESIRAIQGAMELGVTFFDTADAYGTGHSERVLGQAIKGKRDQVVIATKFGHTYDERQRKLLGTDSSPAYIRRALEASLRRLHTNYIDLYQLHIWSLPYDAAQRVADTLEELVAEELICSYGWSTDCLECARWFAKRPHCTAIQHNLNIFDQATDLLKLCDKHNLASINRSPLAMGLLSGKFDSSSQLPASDVRGSGHDWVAYFEDGKPRQKFLNKLNNVREVLTSDGRTLAQGALAWIWGKSPRAVPIPGFKNLKQAEENAKAMQFGPLSAEQMREVDGLLAEAVAA